MPSPPAVPLLFYWNQSPPLYIPNHTICQLKKYTIRVNTCSSPLFSFSSNPSRHQFFLLFNLSKRDYLRSILTWITPPNNFLFLVIINKCDFHIFVYFDFSSLYNVYCELSFYAINMDAGTHKFIFFVFNQTCRFNIFIFSNFEFVLYRDVLYQFLWMKKKNSQYIKNYRLNNLCE
jgi:hypothetical protein